MLKNINVNVWLIALTILLSVSCNEKPKYKIIDGFAQGTTYHIVYKENNATKHAADSIKVILDEFDKTFSNYKDSSLVNMINQSEKPDTIALNEWFIECFETSQLVSKRTDGLFDITMRPLIELYGFGTSKIDESNNVDQPTIDSLLKIIGYNNIYLQTDQKLGSIYLHKDIANITIDFNAIAQGYSADIVAEWLESMNVNDYMVEIGGEIYCQGVNAQGNEWRVGVDRPVQGNYSPGQDIQAIINISGRGLATSGNYRKFYKTNDGTKISHTIDPRTGRSVTHNLLSATIIAPTAMLADAIATASMVGGLEKAQEIVQLFDNCSAMLVYSTPDNQYEVYMSDGMKELIAK